MLIILFLLATSIVMAFVLVAVLRHGRVTFGDGTIERTENPKLFVLGVLGQLLLALAALVGLIRAIRDAITGTGMFAVHGVFDFSGQGKAGAALVVLLGLIAWFPGRRWLDARRRRSLRAEIECSAGDLNLPPNDIDFDTVVELYDHAELATIRDMLRAKPPGQRALRVVLDELDAIAGDKSEVPGVVGPQAEPVAPIPAPEVAKSIGRYSPSESLSPVVRAGLRNRAWQRLVYFPAIAMTPLPLAAAALHLAPDGVLPWLYGVALASGLCWFGVWLQLFHGVCPRCNSPFATVERVDGATITAALAERCGACGVPLAAGRRH